MRYLVSLWLHLVLIYAARAAPPPYQRTQLTTNLTSGTFSDGEVPVWDSILGKWKNGAWPSSGGVVDFTNTIANLVGGADTNRIYFVQGYSSVNDGGEGNFYWDATSTAATNRGTIFKKSGVTTGRWRRFMEGNRYRVDWFGAKGDNSTDDAVAIQNAIDCVTAYSGSFSKGGEVIFTQGKKYLVGTMLIMQTTNNSGDYSFCQGVTLRGDNGSLVDTERTPQLNFTNQNVAGIALQFARDVVFENLGIKGQNTMPNLTGTPISYITNANFYNSTVAARTNRYSPHAGIVTDPFSANIANGGDMTNPTNQYPGFAAYYHGTTRSGSAKVHFRHCTFQNWICGLMLNPDTANQQGDGMTVENCVFNYNKFSVAIGQSQSRGCSVLNCDSAYQEVFIQCAMFGQARGACPVVTGGQHNSAKYLICVPADFGPINFTDTYSESILSIGNIGTRDVAQNTSASFKGCYFSFVQAAPQEIDYHATIGCSTVFEGCSFLTADLGALHFLVRYAEVAAYITTFIGCQFRANIGAEAPNLSFDRWERVRFIECGIQDAGTMRILTDRAQWWNPDIFSRSLVLPGESVLTGTNDWRCYGLFPDVGVGETSTTFDGNGGATIVFDSAVTNLLQVGDVVSDGGGIWMESANEDIMDVQHPYMGIVSAITGTNVTLAHVPISYTNQIFGAGHCRLRWIPRWHPEGTGDTVLNGYSITNVSNITKWSVGDRVRGTGLVDGTYITATNASAGGTITLSRKASATAAAVRLYDADVR